MDLRPHRPPLPRRTRRLVGEAAALFALLAVAGCKGTGSGASPGPACGDGKLGAGEVCDGAALNGQSCATRGFAGGTLACKGDCSGFDTAGCTTGSTCGDGRLDPGEVCDGAALDGQSCATRGFAGGTLACKGDCSGFDATGCTTGGALPAAAAPTMSPPPGSSTTPVRVTLACSTPGCSVRFTIDGAAITAASPRYADPLTVSSTTVVQAVAVAPGHAPSPVAKGIYVVDPGTGPQLAFHTVRLDAGGAVLPWIPSGHAYAEAVLRNGARLLRFPFAVLNTHAALDWPPGDGVSSGSPNNPAGKNAMIADSALLAYPYTGDRALVDLAVALYDHQLAHGMTGRTGYAWPHVPYASAADGASVFDGASAEEGLHVIEPDKVAEWGVGALRLYEHTGDSTYRDAAVDCADALVQHVVTGSASVSPWPWRVNAETGVTVEGYCAHTAAALELLDELVRLGLGDAGAYAATRSKVWSWTVTVPLASGAWGRYFEDQPTPQAVTNVNQYSPGQLARYLLEHPEKDPAWHAHVDALVAWIESTFAHVEYGANAIAEQAAWNYVMESHTSRYGAVNALLAEATGDAAAHDKAFRALGWATYFMDDDGSTSVMHGTPSTWFTDSHGDFIRHYVIAMAADPAAWAPAGEDHLLRSSSVVTNVSYGPGRVAYETFDAAAREVLRLTFTPTAVQAGGVSLPARADLAAEGWVFDAGTGVLRIRHDASRTVSVSGTVSTP